jgi:hypothetical protein
VWRRPVESLNIGVSTTTPYVTPGGTVNMVVTTNQPHTPIAVTVVDDRVRADVPKRHRPPMLPAMAYLEDEVLGELTDADAYLFVEGEGEDQEVKVGGHGFVGRAEKLDLLLGCEGWRRFVYENVTAFLEKRCEAEETEKRGGNPEDQPEDKGAAETTLLKETDCARMLAVGKQTDDDEPPWMMNKMGRRGGVGGMMPNMMMRAAPMAMAMNAEPIMAMEMEMAEPPMMAMAAMANVPEMMMMEDAVEGQIIYDPACACCLRALQNIYRLCQLPPITRTHTNPTDTHRIVPN